MFCLNYIISHFVELSLQAQMRFIAILTWVVPFPQLIYQQITAKACNIQMYMYISTQLLRYHKYFNLTGVYCVNIFINTLYVYLGRAHSVLS